MTARFTKATAILMAAVTPVAVGGLVGCESAGKGGNAGIGALLGAALGAGIVAASGGDSEDVLIAALGGAVVGAGVGYAVGDILEKRAASREEKQKAKAAYEEAVAKGAALGGEAESVDDLVEDVESGAEPVTPASEADQQVAKEKLAEILDDAAAKDPESDKPGRVAVEVEENTFVLVDPLTGEPEESAYVLSAEEAEKFRDPTHELAKIDGYTVLVAGLRTDTATDNTAGTSNGAS